MKEKRPITRGKLQLGRSRIARFLLFLGWYLSWDDDVTAVIPADKLPRKR